MPKPASLRQCLQDEHGYGFALHGKEFGQERFTADAFVDRDFIVEVGVRLHENGTAVGAVDDRADRPGVSVRDPIEARHRLAERLFDEAGQVLVGPVGRGRRAADQPGQQEFDNGFVRAAYCLPGLRVGAADRLGDQPENRGAQQQLVQLGFPGQLVQDARWGHRTR